MVYFTADTHFDHANIIRFCNRPFATVEEMNEALIANWNRKVHGNDIVYILGDMFFRTTDPTPILQRLKGKKRLIVGNHDSQWMKKVDLSLYFESVDHYLETNDGQHTLTLCHFPQMSWNHQRRSFMIHGHIHENTDMDYWPLILMRDNLLNAGCDINNYEPATFEELIENNRKHKERHPQQMAVEVPGPEQAEADEDLHTLLAQYQEQKRKIYRHYEQLVAAVQAEQIQSEDEIQSIMDGLVGFGDDGQFYGLFQQLCRYIYHHRPELVGQYPSLFRLQFEEKE